MARDFDGSADYLTRTGTPIITGFPFTVSAMVNIDSAGSAPAIFQFGISTANTNRVGLYVATANKLIASSRNGSSTTTFQTSSIVSTGVWRNVVGTFETGEYVYAYLDGNGAGSYTAQNAHSWLQLVQSTGVLRYSS